MVRVRVMARVGVRVRVRGALLLAAAALVGAERLLRVG